MELLSIDPLFNLYGERWPFRTYQRPLPPSKYILAGKIADSIVCYGCIISGGTIQDPIISPGVVIERDSQVKQSVVFDDVTIEPSATIRKVVSGLAPLSAMIKSWIKKRGRTISDN